MTLRGHHLVDTELPNGKNRTSASVLATCSCGYFNDTRTEAEHRKAHMEDHRCTRKLKFYRNK